MRKSEAESPRDYVKWFTVRRSLFILTITFLPNLSPAAKSAVAVLRQSSPLAGQYDHRRYPESPSFPAIRVLHLAIPIVSQRHQHKCRNGLLSGRRLASRVLDY